MYNGIGLNTPRGSGTSGHITRNLSSIRPRDDYRSMGDRDMPVQHRAPDAAILEHERKRRIEVQCLELQDSLEEKGAAPEDVEAQVDQLRQTLTAQARSKAPGQPAERGAIKDFQRHELLAAKAVDNARFERAFNISRDYVEGESLNKEKQEERRAQRQLDKERRQVELAERKRVYEAEQEARHAEQVQREATDRAARAADSERHRIEVESRAKDRESRMRDIQRERETDMGHSAPRVRNDLVDSYRPGPSRGEASRRSRSPPSRRPASRRDRSYSRSRSRSASPRRESRIARSRSRSPPGRFSDGRGRPARSVSRSRSPPPRRGRSRTRSYSRSSSSRSPSPRRTNGNSRRRSADSRSVSPAGRRSSPPRRPASPGSRSSSRSPRARQCSATGSEDMDVQSD